MNVPRIGVNILAVIGGVGIVAVGIFYYSFNGVFGGTDESTLKETLRSPAGDVEAIRVVSTGGGGAGWCREFVLVRNSGDSSKLPSYPQAGNDLVFSASCSTSFTMTWAAPSELAVHYKAASGELASFDVRPMDRRRNVSVHLEADT